MAGDLIAEGNAGSLLAVGVYDPQFDEGDTGTLEIDMISIPVGLVASLDFALDVAGIDATVTTAPGSVVVIDFTKSLGMIAVAAALTVVFVAAILLLVTAWALFRGVITATNVSLALILGIVLVGGAVLVAGGRRQRARHAQQPVHRPVGRPALPRRAVAA